MSANDKPAVAKTESSAKPRVKDRIFETACDLFYRQGIRCVGVDTIASEAGTNKMSFYRSFPSKDDLVVEYLEKQSEAFWEWWDSIVSTHPDDPRRQIEALFAGQVAKACPQNQHGCAFINAAVELRDTDRDAIAVIHRNKAEIRKRLRKMAKATGAKSPDLLGDALVLLAEGNAMTHLSFAHEEWPGLQSPKIVKKLLDAFLA